MNEKCFIHPDRDAVGFLKVPCAPGGKLQCCEECEKPENLPKVFKAYQDSHSKTIKVFKQTNPGS